MNIIDSIKLKAKENNNRIVLPEYMDARVLNAARIATDEGIASIILLGNKEEIESKIDINGITIIDPKESELTNTFINKLYDMRKEKGLTIDGARELLLNDYMYFACMLVNENLADGVVSGACHSSANTLRPALQIIKTKSGTKLVSAFFLMDVPNTTYGENGVFIFGDAGLVQNPTSEELAYIGEASAKSFEQLTGKSAKVAFLSHSTMGSAEHNDVTKVREAVKIAKEKFSEYEMDGELQLDAAIVPEVAKMKAPNSEVAGNANVLIFPDLDAGNIGYKLVQRLANAEAYGPITQGIKKPVNDLSRGCSVLDIVGAIAITSVQVDK